MEQKTYWNQAAEKKEFTTPFQAVEFAEYVSRDAQILDVGCGYGRTLNELSQAGFTRLMGLDFAEEMIRRGRTQYPALDLCVMESGRIPLPDKAVDAVILFAVLTCIADDKEQEQLITEIHRVLKPGGILYVNDFLLNTDERNVSRYQEFQKKYGIYGVFELPEGAVCRHHDKERIRRLLSGFAPLHHERLVFTTMNGHRSNGFYFIGRCV